MKEFLKTEIISTGNFSLTIGNIMIAIVIFIGAYLLFRVIALLITRSFQRRNRKDSRHFSIIQLVKYFIWILAIVFILQSLRINVTFLIASSAALLVGIGLGLQNIFKDFISGFILLIEGTVKVDDIVEVDDLVVKVNEISLRTSKVTTRDDNIVIIPNHRFIEEKLVNWTNNMLPSRFTIEVHVDYTSDTRLVEATLIECALNQSDVLKDEGYQPSVRFKNFGDFALDFQLIFFSFNLFRIENVKSKIRFLIYDAFKKNNITIPLPQHVIRYPDSTN